jgi:hypothetical protein
LFVSDEVYKSVTHTIYLIAEGYCECAGETLSIKSEIHRNEVRQIEDLLYIGKRLMVQPRTRQFLIDREKTSSEEALVINQKGKTVRGKRR